VYFVPVVLLGSPPTVTKKVVGDGFVPFFVRRFTGNDTAIVMYSDGAQTAIDSPAIELDPEFSRDGQSLFYSSAKAAGHRRESLGDGLTRRFPFKIQSTAQLWRILIPAFILQDRRSTPLRAAATTGFAVHGCRNRRHALADRIDGKRLARHSRPWADDLCMSNRMPDGNSRTQ
jgi:hypothetical protein